MRPWWFMLGQRVTHRYTPGLVMVVLERMWIECDPLSGTGQALYRCRDAFTYKDLGPFHEWELKPDDPPAPEVGVLERAG